MFGNFFYALYNFGKYLLQQKEFNIFVDLPSLWIFFLKNF